MVKQEKSSIKLFFEENRSLVFLLPLLAVLVVIAFIVLSKSNKALTTSADFSEDNRLSSENQVIVLPQTNRVIDEESSAVKKDPFESPFVLTGIIYSQESPLAILESENISSIVGVGSTVGDSSWKVVSIDKDTVTLSNGSETITLDIISKVHVQN